MNIKGTNIFDLPTFELCPFNSLRACLRPSSNIICPKAKRLKKLAKLIFPAYGISFEGNRTARQNYNNTLLKCKHAGTEMSPDVYNFFKVLLELQKCFLTLDTE